MIASNTAPKQCGYWDRPILFNTILQKHTMFAGSNSGSACRVAGGCQGVLGNSLLLQKSKVGSISIIMGSFHLLFFVQQTKIYPTIINLTSPQQSTQL